jgi:hypothetical protein
MNCAPRCCKRMLLLQHQGRAPAASAGLHCSPCPPGSTCLARTTCTPVYSIRVLHAGAVTIAASHASLPACCTEFQLTIGDDGMEYVEYDKQGKVRRRQRQGDALKQWVDEVSSELAACASVRLG